MSLFLFCASFALSAHLVILSVKLLKSRARQARTGRCARCGYPADHRVGPGICPECGSDPSSIPASWLSARQTFAAWFLVSLILLVVFVPLTYTINPGITSSSERRLLIPNRSDEPVTARFLTTATVSRSLSAAGLFNSAPVCNLRITARLGDQAPPFAEVRSTLPCRPSGAALEAWAAHTTDELCRDHAVTDRNSRSELYSAVRYGAEPVLRFPPSHWSAAEHHLTAESLTRLILCLVASAILAAFITRFTN
ncbi:MAG: hypothetical protein ACK4WH_10910 [Phycisphaerales bacterium]